MTGRDVRAFVTQRNRDNGDLMVQMKNGFGSSKYKPVDYQLLRAETEAKKLASAGIQLKIKKIQNASKITKDQMLIKQHSQVWWKEHQRLSENRDKLELQLKMFLEDRGKTCNFFADMADVEQQLSEERDGFKACTIHPIWQLREDLKHRICQLRHHSLHRSHMENDFDPETILQQVESVKSQQNNLIEKLMQHQQALEEDILQCDMQEFIHSEDVIYEFSEGPAILQEIECPYPDVKDSILKEYQKLADLYLAKMTSLHRQLEETDRNCTWSKEEHWILQSVITQYPCDLTNRRMLYLDMLSRHLPHKPRQELVNHEKIWESQRFISDQTRALMDSWHRHKKDFVMKAIMTVAEACSAYETELILTNDRKRQEEICLELKEKVMQWRVHQEETARLESFIAARRQEAKEQHERQRREREKLHQVDAKEKIQKYKAEKQQAWEELQRRDLQRLEELKKIMAQQAEKDRERVVYRQQLLEKRLSERQEVALREEQVELERQRRIEALRQQVAVIAEFDPVRMMGDTKAWKAKMATDTEDDVSLQKPLFELYTYNEQQIVSDQRVRLEMALREAGLHKTLYAKEILPKIPPPKAPRKDTESTVFRK